MRFREFYYLNENIFKRKEIRDSVEILKKYFNHPTAMVSFRNEIPTSSGREMDNPYKKGGINPGINPLVGINPKSTYDTPNGIYGYPIRETKSLIEGNNLPFASDRKYAVVYKPREGVPILRTSTFSKEDLEKKKKLIAEKYFDNDFQKLEDAIESIDSRYKNSPAQILWSLTREISMRKEQRGILVKQDNPNKWAKILISIGVPIFIDDKGEGTIHRSETIQSVIFGRQYLDILETFENNFSYSNNFKNELLRIYGNLTHVYAPLIDFNYKTLAENGITEKTKINELPVRLQGFAKRWKGKNALLKVLKEQQDTGITKLKLRLFHELNTFIRYAYKHGRLEYSSDDYLIEREILKVTKEEILKDKQSTILFFDILKSLELGFSSFEKDFSKRVIDDLTEWLIQDFDFNDLETFETFFLKIRLFSLNPDNIIRKKIEKVIEDNPKKVANYLLKDTLQKIEKKEALHHTDSFKISYIINNFPEDSYPPIIKDFYIPF